jgi:hypothetical protein
LIEIVRGREFGGSGGRERKGKGRNKVRGKRKRTTLGGTDDEWGGDGWSTHREK